MMKAQATEIGGHWRIVLLDNEGGERVLRSRYTERTAKAAAKVLNGGLLADLLGEDESGGPKIVRTLRDVNRAWDSLSGLIRDGLRD